MKFFYVFFYFLYFLFYLVGVILVDKSLFGLIDIVYDLFIYVYDGYILVGFWSLIIKILGKFISDFRSNDMIVIYFFCYRNKN